MWFQKGEIHPLLLFFFKQIPVSDSRCDLRCAIFIEHSLKFVALFFFCLVHFVDVVVVVEDVTLLFL